MAEQAGIEVQTKTIDSEWLRLRKEAIVTALGKCAEGSTAAEDLHEQANIASRQMELARQTTLESIEQYANDLFAASEAGVIYGRDLVVAYAEYLRMYESLRTRQEPKVTVEDSAILEQYNLLRIGPMVAYRNSSENFDYKAHPLLEIAEPKIMRGSARDSIRLVYTFSSDNNNEEKVTREATDLIIGEEAITAKLEKTVNDLEFQLEDYILNPRNRIIEIAELLGRDDISQHVYNLKTNAARVLLSDYSEFNMQSTYNTAARHLYENAPQVYYDVLAELIENIHELLRKYKTAPEYKIFSAMYYAAKDGELEKRYTDFEHIQAAGWFASQSELLKDAKIAQAQLEAEQ